MPRRYSYRRMTPGDFSDDLNALGLTARQFARISGAREDRVLKWLATGKDHEDIPPHVPVLCALLKMPGALAEAKRVTDFYVEDSA